MTLHLSANIHLSRGYFSVNVRQIHDGVVTIEGTDGRGYPHLDIFCPSVDDARELAALLERIAEPVPITESKPSSLLEAYGI